MELGLLTKCLSCMCNWQKIFPPLKNSYSKLNLVQMHYYRLRKKRVKKHLLGALVITQQEKHQPHILSQVFKPTAFEFQNLSTQVCYIWHSQHASHSDKNAGKQKWIEEPKQKTLNTGLTLPQKEQGYFPCWVISIFLTIFLREAPYLVPYLPVIPTFLVCLALNKTIHHNIFSKM